MFSLLVRTYYIVILLSYSRSLHHSEPLVADMTAHSTTPPKALEARIVEACTAHELAHRNDRDYRACVPLEPDYFVRYGCHDAIWSEFQTQQYIFEYTRSNPSQDTPRIPQPIHYFEGSMTAYLVMEFIPLAAPPPDLIDRIAMALACLATVPPPAGHMIGPLGGGRVRHGFFKDDIAPLPFPDIDALQRYMNKVRLCVHSH